MTHKIGSDTNSVQKNNKGARERHKISEAYLFMFDIFASTTFSVKMILLIHAQSIDFTYNQSEY